jgi:hypothetical protein
MNPFTSLEEAKSEKYAKALEVNGYKPEQIMEFMSASVGMAKVADVYISPNSNLSIGSTISNSSGSSQVYRLTVYPNFNRFGGFKSISLTADSGVTFYIANKGGNSPIASNLDYDDLGNVPELKVLKEYDIVITIPSGKEVTGLSFVLQSSSADVSGVISQGCVDGLTGDITRIDSKDSAQDNRLSTLETSTSDIVNVNLVSSSYLVKVGLSIEGFILTATLTDINGNPIKNKSVEFKKDGVTAYTTSTDNNGVARYNAYLTTGGVYDFSVLDKHIIIQTYGFEEIKSSQYNRYVLYVDKARKIAILEVSLEGVNIPSGDSEYELVSFIPSEYRPPLTLNIFSHIGRNSNLILYIWGSGGTVGIANKSSSTLTNISSSTMVQWSYE